MNVSFACPSCAASGSVDAVHVGRQVRCKQCGARFTIPDPLSSDADVYALEESASPPVVNGLAGQPETTVFVSAGREDRRPPDGPRRREGPALSPGSHRKSRSRFEFAWRTWLIRGGTAFAMVVLGIALLAPSGVWLAGCVLMVVGMVLVLIGHLAGAYGAFSEDSLYGFLYLLIPFFTAYYIVTRWDDLWIWFACSTVGAGIALLGVELVRWAGTAA